MQWFINCHVAPGVDYLNVVVLKNCWHIIKSVSNWPRLRVPAILQQDHNHGSHFAVFLFRPSFFFLICLLFGFAILFQTIPAPMRWPT